MFEKENSIYIEDIPRLEWGKGMDTSFIGSTKLVLDVLGEERSYDYLMGISGAAFRLHFNPDWCPSSGDVTAGFDVSRVLFKSLGYKFEMLSIDDSSFNDIRDLYMRIVRQIDLGIPVIAINLKVCPEWGIITGYLKSRPGMLCRTYFDENDEYTQAEHAPWLSVFIGERTGNLDENGVLQSALRIAIEIGRTEEFNDYKSGLSAFEVWMKELRDWSGLTNLRFFKHHEVNLTLFNCLLDSRKAAVGFLTEADSKEKLKNGERIIENYRKEVDLLSATQESILPSFDSQPGRWTQEILEKQAMILEQVKLLESETLSLMEEEIDT